MTCYPDDTDRSRSESFASRNLTYEWDRNKSESNFEKHGIDFVSVTGFEWDTAVVRPSDRRGEKRFVAYGYLDDRLHSLAFAIRGDRIRIISFRKADDREERYYAESQT